MLTVADVMTRDVITVTSDTSVQEIAKLFYAQRIGGVPVVDADARVVGLVSEGDLIGHIGAIGEEPQPRSWWLSFFSDQGDLAQQYAKTHGRSAQDVMTSNVITITETASLAETATILERNRIKRLPVVRDGKLVGIVTRANLLQALATADVSKAVSSDDRAIREQLESELARQPWARSPNMNIVVQDGVVHLWGSVWQEQERRALRVAAENVPGVKGVEDHLTLFPTYPGWD